jgi:hypothetical protein
MPLPGEKNGMKHLFLVWLWGAALTATLSAQWPRYPYANAPRTPDGKLDLTAPAQRTTDGKPDLSGVWMSQASGPNEPGRPPRAAFGNTGIGFKDDLPFQPWARELQKKRSAEFSKDNPDGLCLPESTMQLHLDPQPFRIVQTPGAIFIFYETNYGVRTIYTDGRPLPPQGEPQPYWYGYSVGRWEGDTLVVQTNNYRDGGWLDARGSPVTDALRVTERIRRVNYGQIDVELTVDDPKAYTQPFTVRIDERLLPDGSDLIEFICNENQQFGKRVKIQ